MSDRPRPSDSDIPSVLDDLLADLPDHVGENLDAAIRAVLPCGDAALFHCETDDLDVEDAGRGAMTAADRASNEAILECLATRESTSSDARQPRGIPAAAPATYDHMEEVVAEIVADL